MSGPFTPEEFYNPKIAFENMGVGVALSAYMNEVEPLYIDDNRNNGLPIDWEWRRAFVYFRDEETCQGCGQFRPRLADTHHIEHRASGGNHAVENLVLLCRQCHEDEHPDKCWESNY